MQFNVQTVGGDFKFTPDTLVFNVISTDVLAGTSVVYYRLYYSGPIDKTKYISRNWIDEGNIVIPTVALVAASTDGQLNKDVVNSILASFNLALYEAPAPIVSGYYGGALGGENL